MGKQQTSRFVPPHVAIFLVGAGGFASSLVAVFDEGFPAVLVRMSVFQACFWLMVMAASLCFLAVMQNRFLSGS